MMLAEKFANISERAHLIINNHVRLTPVIRSPALERLTGAASVYLKLESEQVTGSFKARGAVFRILSLESCPPLLTCSSSGNHAIAFQHALKALKDSKRFDSPPPADIYLSPAVDPGKVAKLRNLGASLVFRGQTSLDAELAARSDAEAAGGVYVSPYNDELVVGGQGTIGLELLEQIPELDTVFVPVGGGGLIGGIAAVLKSRGPRPIHVIGCQPLASESMRRSILADRVVDMDHDPTLSDGTAGGLEEDTVTFALCRETVDSWVSVPEASIGDAMRLVYKEHGKVIEGAAGVAVASLVHVARAAAAARSAPGGASEAGARSGGEAKGGAESPSVDAGSGGDAAGRGSGQPGSTGEFLGQCFVQSAALGPWGPAGPPDLRGRHVCVVICGGNVSEATKRAVLGLDLGLGDPMAGPWQHRDICP